jgi:dUTP pyrophosphatase
MKIKVTKLHDQTTLPQYQTQDAAGMDLHARLDAPVTLGPLERRMIPTGIAISLPVGYEAQIRARSGLAIKHGITMINGIGTVDADYRGEIGVLLVNLSNELFVIEPDMRIAQMIIAQYQRIVWEVVDELDATDRGDGGYGSTGITRVQQA